MLRDTYAQPERTSIRCHRHPFKAATGRFRSSWSIVARHELQKQRGTSNSTMHCRFFDLTSLNRAWRDWVLDASDN